MKIERSNDQGRFTVAELEAKVRESRAFWASPAGKAAQAKLDKEKRERKPVARRSSPSALAYWEKRFALLEITAPKF